MTDVAPSRARRLAVLILCSVAYLYVFPYQSRMNNPNENVRFYMTAAIVEHGTYAIDAQRARWGWVNDAATREGRYYSAKAPGTSFLGVPAYAAYHALSGGRTDRTTALWVCRVFASTLPALVFFAFFHGWLGRRVRFAPGRDAVLLSLALGSLLYAYALLFVSHTLSAACAGGAFALLYDARHGARPLVRRDALAGLLAAGVTFFDFPGLIASTLLSLYALAALRRPLRLAAFAVGALPPLLLVLHFHAFAFGSPFTPGHGMQENAQFRALATQGFFGATGFSLEAARGLLLAPGYGLFSTTPILALAVPGFVRLFAKRGERLDAAVALLIVAGTTIAICAMNNWRGGWTVGPRYLALVVPLLAWPAAVGLERIGRRLPRATTVLAVGLCAAGFVASGTLSAWYPHVPEDQTYPVAHLFRLLWSHGYAPYNAGHFAGAHGTASMLPLVLVAILALALVGVPRHLPARTRALVAATGGAAAVLAALPYLVLPPPPSEGQRAGLAFLLRNWTPPGHDDAARLEARLRRGEAPPEALWRLVSLYRAEGRDDEAEAAAGRARLEAFGRK